MEIITFYALIISAVFFLFFSAIFKFKNTSFTVEDVKDTTDFITWTKDIYKYFGLISTLFVVTIVLYIFEEDKKCVDIDNQKGY